LNICSIYRPVSGLTSSTSSRGSLVTPASQGATRRSSISSQLPTDGHRTTLYTSLRLHAPVVVATVRGGPRGSWTLPKDSACGMADHHGRCVVVVRLPWPKSTVDVAIGIALHTRPVVFSVRLVHPHGKLPNQVVGGSSPGGGFLPLSLYPENPWLSFHDLCLAPISPRYSLLGHKTTRVSLCAIEDQLGKKP
jgi:hypothetical protein